MMRIAACLVLAAVPQIGASQTEPARHDIPDQETCPSCQIAVRPILTIGQEPDSVDAVCGDSGAVVAWSPAGRYYVAPTCDEGRIAVFSESGKRIETFGRNGQGPGEFQGIRRIAVDDAGTVYVLDNARFLAVLTDEHSRLRTLRLNGFPYSWVVLSDGRLVVHSLLQDSSGAALFQLRSSDGQQLARFGRVSPAGGGRLAETTLSRHVIARRGEGGLWAAPSDEYVVSFWGPNMELEGELRRDAAWFERGPPRTPGVSNLTGLVEISDGLLLVLIATASDDFDWRAFDEGVENGTHREITGSSPSDRFDTVLEVLDVRTNRVVKRERHESLLVPCGGTCVYSGEHDAQDESVRQIWDVALLRPTGRE